MNIKNEMYEILIIQLMLLIEHMDKRRKEDDLVYAKVKALQRSLKELSAETNA